MGSQRRGSATKNQNPRVRTIDARTCGQYLVDPPEVVGPAPLLIGFHGYGENAERHLEALRRLPGASQWLIVSVDALHRFYRSQNGAVIGSWMTRQNREAAIGHNIAYVRSIVERVTRDWQTTGVLVYAGFSQGVAMAYRAAARCGHPCTGIIALAGDVPPELTKDSSVVWPRTLVARGRDDTRYTQATMDADLTFLSAAGVSVESLVFSGGHEWVDEFRDTAGAFLMRCQVSSDP